MRHLLTHTAGIGYWRRFSDLLRPAVGSGVRAGRSMPSLADYYRGGLPVEVEPGTKWVYSNHGFATLGQIVEDVSGQPLDRYLRDHIFDSLGMEHSDLIRSERVSPQLATGYVLRSRGLRPVVDRDVLAAGGGAVYSTTGDMARYVAALLHMGSGEHGSVLKPDTLASMFEPHFQLDPRVPGMGLGFLLGEEGGHRTVGHDGIVSGFLSQMAIAPDDGIGVVVFANTGGLDGRGAPEMLGAALLRRLLGLPYETIRTDVPVRPESWSDVCGWYSPDPGPVTNLFVRAVVGAGAEVTVRGGHLMLQPLTPIPAMRSGLRLYPDDHDDPRVFRIDFSEFGKGTLRVVFTDGAEAGATATRLLLDGMSLRKRPGIRNPRPWVTGVLGAGATALAIRYGQHRKASAQGVEAVAHRGRLPTADELRTQLQPWDVRRGGAEEAAGADPVRVIVLLAALAAAQGFVSQAGGIVLAPLVAVGLVALGRWAGLSWDDLGLAGRSWRRVCGTAGWRSRSSPRCMPWASRCPRRARRSWTRDTTYLLVPPS